MPAQRRMDPSKIRGDPTEISLMEEAAVTVLWAEEWGAAVRKSGSASPIRLWTSNLYGQGSWLLLFAIISMFACIKKWNSKKNVRQSAFVFWSLWLVTMTVFFSFAGFYHRYYLCMMAPAICSSEQYWHDGNL